MSEDSRPINIQISFGTILKAVLIIIATYALYRVRDVLLILLTSLVIASAIEPGVRWLKGKGLHRIFSVMLIYLFVVAIILLITIIFIPPMLTEISHIADTLPQYLADFKVTDIIPGVSSTGDLVGSEIFSPASIREGIEVIRNALVGLSQGFFQTAAILFGGALSAVLILVISFYLAVEERGIENFLRVIIPLPREQYVINLWKRAQGKIGKWLQGQLLLGIVVGVLVFLGLSVLGVPYATTLAALAALLEIIPVFGPILSAIPAALVAFSISPSLGFMVVGLYVIIQQFENHLITPLVITRIVGIPPIIVIVALLVGAKLAGFLGIILAVPLCTIFVEIFNDLEKRKIASASSAG
ncbi:MAG TPA: AI-2E family transporter [Candidatus Paceibacterota bacterium]